MKVSDAKKRIHQRETSWNDNVSSLKHVSADHIYSMPGFAVSRRLYPANHHEPRSNPYEALNKSNKPVTTYESIASALGFTHHEGSNRFAELAVVKKIVSRENALMNLHFLHSKKTSSYLKILEAMTRVRDGTVEYIESLNVWRMEMKDFNPLQPRIFYWNGSNYTIKLVHDLDFLSSQVKLVQSLGVTEDLMRMNPLMLPQSLDSPDLGIDPRARAIHDSKGADSGPIFIERLRLRKAERILLQELQAERLKDDVSVVAKAQAITEAQVILGDDYRSDLSSSTHAGIIEIPADLVIPDEPSWVHEARLQLEELKLACGEKLRSQSTKRLSKIHVSEVDEKAPGFPRYIHKDLAPWDVEPTPLTELLSSKIKQQQISPSSQRPSRPLHTQGEENESLRLGEAFDLDDEDEVDLSGEVDEPRENPRVEGPTLEQLTARDVEILTKLPTPFVTRGLVLAGAVFFLAYAPYDPTRRLKDVSWLRFVHFLESYPKNGVEIAPSAVLTKEKMDEIKPALPSIKRQLFITLQQPPATSSTEIVKEKVVIKFLTWITSFIRPATFIAVPSRASPVLAPPSPPPTMTTLPGSSKKSMKMKIMKSEDQVVYTEVVNHLHDHPIVLTLLAPAASSASVVDRLIVKAYDVTTSQEISIVINIREHTLLLYELHDRLGDEVLRHFNPAFTSWWVENLKDIIQLRSRSNNRGIYGQISKKLIENLIRKRIADAEVAEDPADLIVNTDDETDNDFQELIPARKLLSSKSMRSHPSSSGELSVEDVDLPVTDPAVAEGFRLSRPETRSADRKKGRSDSRHQSSRSFLLAEETVQPPPAEDTNLLV